MDMYWKVWVCMGRYAYVLERMGMYVWVGMGRDGYIWVNICMVMYSYKYVWLYYVWQYMIMIYGNKW